MRWAFFISCGALLSLVGCGETSSPTATAATTNTLSRPPPPRTTTSRPSRAGRPTKRPASRRPGRMPRNQRAEFVRLRRQARALARQGRHAQAVPVFDRLVQMRPRSPRLLCEAGYVAEQAGNTDSALRRLRLGIGLIGTGRPTGGMRTTMARCLYNLGRVYEARRRVARARRAYRRSLALRSNRIVRARLSAMTAQQSGRGELFAANTMDELEETLGRCGPSRRAHRSEGEELRAALGTASEPGPIPRAALLGLTLCENEDCTAREVFDSVAIRVPGGYRVFDIGDGVLLIGERHSAATDSVRFDRPAGTSLWRIDIASSGGLDIQHEVPLGDDDESEHQGSCYIDFGAHHTSSVVLCDDAGNGCAVVLLGSRQDPNEIICESAEIPPHVAREYGSNSDPEERFELTIRDGQITYRQQLPVTPPTGEHAPPILGTHSIAEFMRLARRARPRSRCQGPPD